MTDDIDLSRISKRDRNVKLSRVFRDPAESGLVAIAPKFEIWIVFEFDGRHLINAQVLKSNGIDRPFDRQEVKAIDVQIAKGVTTDHPVHEGSNPGEYKFVEYGTDREFLVSGSELIPLLEAQLSKLQPKIRERDREAEQSDSKNGKPGDTRNRPEGKSAVQRSGALMEDIDSLLEESGSLIRDFRATNPD